LFGLHGWATAGGAGGELKRRWISLICVGWLPTGHCSVEGWLGLLAGVLRKAAPDRMVEDTLNRLTGLRHAPSISWCEGFAAGFGHVKNN
jgi:hypothetical protein